MDSVKLRLLERLTVSAWRAFDAFRFAGNRLINIRAKSVEELAVGRLRARDLLSREGMTPTLPELGRVDCLGSSTEVANIAINEYLRTVQVVVAADDERRLGQLVELFLDNVPDATVNERLRSIAVHEPTS